MGTLKCPLFLGEFPTQEPFKEIQAFQEAFSSGVKDLPPKMAQVEGCSERSATLGCGLRTNGITLPSVVDTILTTLWDK